MAPCYVGRQQAGYDLCGRPAILAPQVLDPKTLTLKAAKVQRLDEAETEAAPVLDAKPAASAPVAGSASPSTETKPAAATQTTQLLHARWATSAAPGAPASALTDGKLETAWAEGRGGTGRGELVVVSAPREVAIGGFEIALPDAPRAACSGAA